MIRQLSRSIREYKMASLATPLLVSGEVVMECLIPFLIAELVNEVKSGCDMNRMLRYGLLLVLLAALSHLSRLKGGFATTTWNFINLSSSMFCGLDRVSPCQMRASSTLCRNIFIVHKAQV